MGCYAPGYIGPKDNGSINYKVGIKAAADAGCRLFVFEIDYFEDCSTKEHRYYPCLVVKNHQGISQVIRSSETVHCNSNTYSSITDACNNINEFLFGSGCQNRRDPVIIVLSFKRLPPPADDKTPINSKTVLDYYALVAKCLNSSALKYRFLTYNHLSGGNFTRQSQESTLINSPLSTFQDKVLLFSTGTTSGFCDSKLKASGSGTCNPLLVPGTNNTVYEADEDLDFLVVLRLSHNITKICLTEANNSSGNIDAVESFLESSISKINAPEVFEQKVDMMKRKWSICVPRYPLNQVSQEDYKYLTTTFGINCIVTQLYQPGTDHLLTDTTFKTKSFYPRIEPVRMPHPPVLTAEAPQKLHDTNCGIVEPPTTAFGGTLQ
jgi:hypothetical protein